MKRCPCGIGPDVHAHNGHKSKESKIRELEQAVIEAAKQVDKSLGVNRTSSDIALHEALDALEKAKQEKP